MMRIRFGYALLAFLLLLLIAVASTRTVQARPNATDSVIYTDAIVAPWDPSYSFSTTVELDSDVAHSGKAIAVTHTTGRGALSVHNDTALTGAEYSSISFWGYGATGGSSLLISIGDDPDAFYPVTLTASTWTQYTVPLSALGNPATIDRINWQDATGAAQPTYYLDDIAVLAAPAQTGFPDATPDGMYTFKPGPSGVAVAPNGRVYAVVYQADQVYSWPTVSSMISGAAPDKTFGTSNGNPDKGCTNAPSPTTMCGPESIAVDHNGNLFVADTYNHRVLVFMNPDTDGSPVKADSVLGQLDLSLGVPDSDSNNADGVMEGFCYVRGLAVDADNHLWAVDEFNFRVIRFDTPLLFGSKPSKVFGQADLDDNPAGCADGASGNSGANQFSLPLGVAVDQQGTLYVTDFDNNRVQRFAADAPNGADAEASYTSGLDHAHDVAIDGAGNVYIASTFGNQVLVFAGGPNGDLVSDHAFPGRNYPMGMAFTVGGDFLVADCGAPLANTDYPPCLSGERGVYFFAAPEPSQFQPPNAADDSATTPKNNAVSGNVLTNDSDPQASALTVTAFAQPDQGTVTVAASGVFTYTPPADFVGQASFGYTVSNSHDLTDTATVSVTVVESLPKSGLFIPSLSRQP